MQYKGEGMTFRIPIRSGSYSIIEAFINFSFSILTESVLQMSWVRIPFRSEFFQAWFHNCLSCVHNCGDQSYLHIILHSSKIWTLICSLVFWLRNVFEKLLANLETISRGKQKMTTQSLKTWIRSFLSNLVNASSFSEFGILRVKCLLTIVLII